MTTESSMYAKVRAFVAGHWKAAEAMTKHDSGPHAHGKGISLSFGGVRVEPDIYGIVMSNSVELPILGEGKLRMGGHTGTQAFAQALTYRNLGMLSFLFFPESEFDTAAAPMFKAMCAQAGIGLLKVPSGRTPIDPKTHVVVELAGGEPNDVAAAIEQTLTQIKGVGQRHLADIYPHSLRDLLALIDLPTIDHDVLERRFVRAWPRFASVLRQRPYDPMVAKKIAGNKPSTKIEYFHKFIGALLALGLIAPTTAGFRKTERGEHLYGAITPSDLYQSALAPYLQRLFAFAVMREFEESVIGVLEVLRRAGAPVSSRAYCLRRACGQHQWQSARFRTPTGALRCPKCGGRSIHPGIWHQAQDMSIASAMSYSLRKFACAVGLLEARSAKDWREQFPRVPAKMPSGRPIRWDYYWVGPALTG